MGETAGTFISPGAFQEIIDEAASDAVSDGSTIGIAIGATLGGQTYTANAGHRSVGGAGGAAEPVASDTIFQLASVTKVFTTGLFGRQVSKGGFSLSQTLDTFASGALPGIAGNAPLAGSTLQGLATFATGLPSQPRPRAMGGYHRPTIAEWGVSDFVPWFTGLGPTTTYNYSDISTGMLGLLCTAQDPESEALDPDAVTTWLDHVGDHILQPLGMSDTVVVGISELSPGQDSRLAQGYQQALAEAVVAGGEVTGVTLVDGGETYATAPAVGFVATEGGAGASATAILSEEQVSCITVDDGGTGYASAPDVTIAPGDSLSNNVPVWAAAGALSSTVDDMLVLLQRCLTAYNSEAPSDPLDAGLKMAMQAYGTIPEDPSLQYGMAWKIGPGYGQSGTIIFKDGGLPGVSTYISLVPKHDLALVVLCNSMVGGPAPKATESIWRKVFLSD